MGVDSGGVFASEPQAMSETTELSEDFKSMREQDARWDAMKLIGIGVVTLGVALAVIFYAATTILDGH
jgi:hypothetical protein